MKTEPHHPINPIVEGNFYVEQGRTVLEAKYEGLTKREYFATMAMQGYLAGDPKAANENRTVIEVTKWSVKVADALILALNTQ